MTTSDTPYAQGFSAGIAEGFRQGQAGVIGEIAVERHRQIEVEGWDTEHDDGHDVGELAAAAACYCGGAHRSSEVKLLTEAVWPWDRVWFKPKGPRRDLIRAAALIVAEIERLDRAAT